jgi:hypothetical protein
MDATYIDLTVRLSLALILGGAIGIEREYRAKEAGFRTHFLVALGSALFCVVSQYGFGFDLKDSSRVAAQVVSGIGFLGAGTIIFQKNVVRGLTTAAGLWVTAAIGLACGTGMYVAAAITTMMVLMELRGVKDAECINLFDEHLVTGFDTILLLMNGTGIAGKIENLPTLFNRLKALLNKGGQILIDSSDLKYIYENEDGSFDINLNGAYYGEVDYQMIYKDIKGDCFDWLYVDFPLLKSIAETCGMHGELVAEGEHYDYLARIF